MLQFQFAQDNILSLIGVGDIQPVTMGDNGRIEKLAIYPDTIWWGVIGKGGPPYIINCLLIYFVTIPLVK